MSTKTKNETGAGNSTAAQDLLEAVQRALGILNPNVKWTKAETERSWEEWKEQAAAAIAKAEKDAK